MPAGKKNLVLEQGATFTHIVRWKDTNGNPVDLSGFSARMQVRSAKANNTILLELTNTNGRIAINGPSGKLTLTVSAQDTAGIVSGGLYDLEVIEPGAPEVVTRLLEGKITVSREVTR